MDALGVFVSRNQQILKSNTMRITDISHRKIDSEHTSPSAGAQITSCQVSINPVHRRKVAILPIASHGARARASRAKRSGMRKLDDNRVPIVGNGDGARQR